MTISQSFGLKTHVIRGIIALLLLLCSCSSPEEEKRIAVDPSWYPQNFMGKEPAITGFSVELARKALDENGIELSVAEAGPEFLLWGLDRGEWQAVLTSLPPSLNYENIYHFSDPYLQIGPVMVVPGDSSLQQLADLQGKIVAVPRGSLSVAVLGEKVPGIVIVAYDSPAVALENLLQSQYDAVFMPIITAGSFLQDLYGSQLKIVGDPITSEALFFVTLHKQRDLVQFFNEGLDTLKDQGTYNNLITQWKLYFDSGKRF